MLPWLWEKITNGKLNVRSNDKGVDVIEHERKIQVLDLLVVVFLFIIGCVVGKLIMKYASDSWIAFNGPALGIFIIGELIWCRIRKRIKKKWEED